MLRADISGCPGSGKTTLCSPFPNSKSIAWDDLPPPASWRCWIDETTRLLDIVKDHQRPVPTRTGQIPSIVAMTGMLVRSVKTVITVERMDSVGPYIGTGLLQRGIGIGWRLLDMGCDPNLIRPYFWTMPVSIGCVYLNVDPDVLKQRNSARRDVPETSWEDRSFQIDLQLPIIAISKEVLRDRGVPIIEIDNQHQSPDEARAQLLGFANNGLCDAARLSRGDRCVFSSVPPWWR